MSSRGRTRPLSSGPRGGGRRRGGLGVQPSHTIPGEPRPGNAANLDLTDSTHLSVWFISAFWVYVGSSGWLCPPTCLSYYNLPKTVPAMQYISIKHFIFSEYLLCHLHSHLQRKQTSCCRFIRYYTYKSSPSSMPFSSAWYVLPVLEFLADRRLHCISSLSFFLSPLLSQPLAATCNVCVRECVRRRERDREELGTKCV